MSVQRVDAYREHLVGLGLSPNTVRQYTRTMRRVLELADELGVDLDRASPDQVVAIAGEWVNTNPSRRNLRNALMKYWELRGVDAPLLAIRVPPRPRPRWRGLEDDQATRLLDVARGDWPRGAVIVLGLYLGLRREEMARLRWSDFDDDLGWVRIQGKGDRVRHLPVHEEVVAMLRPNRWPGEYVFPGRFGGHVTLTTINNWITDLGRLAGIEGLHPHRLRHTAGGKVNDGTGDVYAAQHFLGHAQVETTLTYTRLGHDRLVEAMHTFDGWRPPPDPEVFDNVVPLRRIP